jgi:crossover junction endodeoxyribonuclease RuvC
VRVLGIDPGLRVCGYALIEAAPAGERLVEAGVFTTDASEPMHRKLDSLARDVTELLERLCPAAVAVEELYSHYAHPRTAILMGHARGVILQVCSAAGVEIRSFSATRIKKSITGNGRASKQQVQRAIQSRLSLDRPPAPNDVADAIAAGLCCVNSIKRVLLKR